VELRQLMEWLRLWSGRRLTSAGRLLLDPGLMCINIRTKLWLYLDHRTVADAEQLGGKHRRGRVLDVLRGRRLQQRGSACGAARFRRRRRDREPHVRGL